MIIYFYEKLYICIKVHKIYKIIHQIYYDCYYLQVVGSGVTFFFFTYLYFICFHYEHELLMLFLNKI